MNRLSTLFLVLAAWLLAAPAVAQDSRLSIDARFVPKAAKPGDEVVLEILGDIEAGYHVYGAKDPGEATRLRVVDAGGLEAVGAVELPDGEPHTVGATTNYWVKGQIVLKQRFKVPATASGTLRLSGKLEYLACTEEFCDPPAKDPFAAKLTIEGGANDGSAASATNPSANPAAQAPVPVSGANVPSSLASSLLQPDSRVSLTARFVPSTAKPGDEVAFELACAIETGYHLYGRADPQPPRLRIVDGAGLEPVGEAEFPAGTAHGSGAATNYWVGGAATYTQRFKVTAQAATGVLRFRAVFEYLACTEEFCDPPAKVPVAARLTIEGGAAPGPDVPPADGGPAPENGEPARDPVPPRTGPVTLRQPKYSLDNGDDLMGSLWSLILLCIGGGLIALVMPCTYPMIPITFSFFTKQADARGGKVLPLALAYGIGIIGIFVLIGVAVGEVITAFAAHWITNLVIGGAFVVFAMTLFGFLVLQPPRFVNQLAGKAGKSGGVLGVFLMGATLVISSFTCTAPIVGSLLASVATAGRARVAFGMGVFGLTMAAPFVLLALLPGRVKALPKSGEWMNTLKVSLGFIELAAALKFFSNVDASLGLAVLPREVFLIAWAFVFTLLALYLFGLFAYRSVPIEGVAKVRNASGVLSLGFAFYCLFGTMGFSLDPVMTAFEPPYRLRAIDEHVIVADNHAEAMALAAKQKKWVLVNFTGFT